MYTLFYYPRNASLAPHFVLEALKVPYQLELVDRKKQAHKSAQYLTLNPTGRIPTLVDEEFVLFESGAICLYLAEKHPESQLIPSQPEKKGEFYQWLMYFTTTVQAELMIYSYPERHTQSALMYDDIVKTQQSRLVSMFEIINRHLAGKHYVVNDQFTVCDCYLFMLCIWADELNKPPLQFEHLANYLRSLAKHPVIKKVCEAELTDLSPYK
ncbi:glutathione S-transferase family protein [Pseudoalteromonas luteoviolacea]|uniref:glutathione S-transferase family protein n=1 Tax=Pseudoalteromonas luteoviolacea TaxID=43657 RepID=UPI00114E5038|nr:glutathione S-transferase family protein [Pseudoalteromonas luteoviolacea]TQF67451.1 glutathione S-transferase family protein [Pseudoalteromonas luteoviolacea]